MGNATEHMTEDRGRKLSYGAHEWKLGYRDRREGNEMIGKHSKEVRDRLMQMLPEQP